MTCIMNSEPDSMQHIKLMNVEEQRLGAKLNTHMTTIQLLVHLQVHYVLQAGYD